MAEAATPVQKAMAEWEERLKELRPQVVEFQEIEQALAAVKGAPKAQVKDNANGGTRKRGRRSGGRADQFLKVVKDNPGITVSQAAKRMDVQPNYLYRLAADGVKEGAIRKEGSGYHPVAEAGSDG